jgi:hypothetical protein
MEYKVKIIHVMSKFWCCVVSHMNPRCLSVSQCGSYCARGCAVLNLEKDMSYFLYGLFGITRIVMKYHCDYFRIYRRYYLGAVTVC